MPTLSLNALRKEVKAGKLAPVYYFHGPEETLKEEALAALIDLAVDPASRDFNFDTRHATTLDPEGLHALVNTLPMMAERRAVVIRDVDGWTVKSPTRRVLLEYLAKPAPETLLVLHQGPPKEGEKDEVDKDLAALTQVVNFAELDADEALAWVTRRTKQLDIQLTPEASAHLVAATGASLALLRLELEQLAAIANKGGRVGNWGTFVDLMVEVAGDWSAGKIRRALVALLEADQALKETRISTEEGVLTDLILQIAARMPAEVGGTWCVVRGVSLLVWRSWPSCPRAHWPHRAIPASLPPSSWRVRVRGTP